MTTTDLALTTRSGGGQLALSTLHSTFSRDEQEPAGGQSPSYPNQYRAEGNTVAAAAGGNAGGGSLPSPGAQLVQYLSLCHTHTHTQNNSWKCYAVIPTFLLRGKRMGDGICVLAGAKVSLGWPTGLGC